MALSMALRLTSGGLDCRTGCRGGRVLGPDADGEEEEEDEEGEASAQLGGWLLLGQDEAEYIFLLLDPRTRARCRLVCKSWYETLASPEVWLRGVSFSLGPCRDSGRSIRHPPLTASALADLLQALPLTLNTNRSSNTNRTTKRNVVKTTQFPRVALAQHVDNLLQVVFDHETKGPEREYQRAATDLLLGRLARPLSSLLVQRIATQMEKRNTTYAQREIAKEAEIMMGWFRHSDSELKATAYSVTGRLLRSPYWFKDAIEWLIACAGHTMVRLGAIEAFESLDEGIYERVASRYAKLVVKALSDSVEQICEVAARTVNKLGSFLNEHERALFAKELAGLLDDASPTVRLAAIEGLGELGAPAALFSPMLITHLEDRNQPNRSASCSTLARLPLALEEVGACRRATRLATQIAPNLVKVSKDWSPTVRLAAINSLGSLSRLSHKEFISKNRNYMSAIVAALHDPDYNVRKAAVKALGKMDVEEHVEDIVDMFEDQDRDVRRKAADVLHNVMHEKGVQAVAEALTKKLGSSNEWTRKAVLSYVEDIEEGSVQALPIAVSLAAEMEAPFSTSLKVWTSKALDRLSHKNPSVVTEVLSPDDKDSESKIAVCNHGFNNPIETCGSPNHPNTHGALPATLSSSIRPAPGGLTLALNNTDPVATDVPQNSSPSPTYQESGAQMEASSPEPISDKNFYADDDFPSLITTPRSREGFGGRPLGMTMAMNSSRGSWGASYASVLSGSTI